MNRGTLLISAGELSGELLALPLLKALKIMAPNLKFVGMGGDLLKKEGMEIFVSYKDIGVNGVWDVIEKIPSIHRALETMIRCSTRGGSPVIGAILVDYPGFHFALAPHLKLRGIPVIQFVAPKVWAWGQKRIPLLKQYFDLVLGIFPFETAFFKDHGVPFQYVGCPVVDRLQGIKPVFPWGDGKPFFCLLPGSRLSEIKKMLPVFCRIALQIRQKHPGALFVLPIAPTLEKEEVTGLIPAALEPFLKLSHGQSPGLIKGALACLAASGTVTLECGILNVPTIATYRMDPLSYRIAKKKVTVPWMSLVNILAQKAITPEYIQSIPVEEIADLLADPGFQKQNTLDLKVVGEILDPFDSQLAARLIGERIFP
jgi:lipid-A-disaccharide synthase